MQVKGGTRKAVFK